ncbi:MAG: hypothetical protein AAF206_21920, partial [Bacteroidota bacterium]
MKLSLTICALLLVALLLPLAGFSQASVGEKDESYGIEGVQTLPFAVGKGNRQIIDVQSDGYSIVAGQINKRDGSIGLMRLDETGMPDLSFGHEGMKILPVRGSVRDLLVMPDDRILVAAIQIHEENSDMVVFQLEKDGRPVELFGRQGKQTINFGEWDDPAKLGLTADGSIMLAGNTSTGDWSNRDFGIARLTSQGRLDPHFGQRGRKIIDIGKYDNCRDLHVFPDGRMMIAGTTRSEKFDEFVVFKLLESGRLDPSFQQKGYKQFHLSKVHDYCQRMAVYPDGKIAMLGHAKLAEGGYGFDLVVMRMDEHGYQDESFGGDGMVSFDLGGAEYGADLLLQADGNLLVLGSSNHKIAMLRLLNNGGIDPSFGRGGHRVFRIGGRSIDGPSEMHMQADGKLLIAGTTKASFTVMRIHGNPYLVGLGDVLAADWDKKGVMENAYAGLSFSRAFSLDAWLKGPDFTPKEDTQISATQEAGPAKHQIARKAHLAIGKNFSLTVIWDIDMNAHYYINGRYSQSVREGKQYAEPSVQPLIKRPMQTRQARKKSFWMLKSLH